MGSTSSRGILLIIVDKHGLDVAKNFIGGNSLAQFALPEALVIVVAVGFGGSLCLSATPAEHIQYVHLPDGLDDGPIVGPEVVADALYEAIHLIGTATPPVWAIGFLDWRDHTELVEQLNEVENLLYIATLKRRDPEMKYPNTTEPSRGDEPEDVLPHTADNVDWGSVATLVFGAMIFLFLVFFFLL